MKEEPIRAPVALILPAFLPIFFECAVPGYAAQPLKPGERRLSPECVRAVLVAAAFVGTWEHVMERGLDHAERVIASTKSAATTDFPVVSVCVLCPLNGSHL